MRPGTVVINGGGISGLACAIALQRQGWQVTVCERAPGPRTGGYMIDFFGVGWEPAVELGIIDAMRRRGRVYRGVRYSDLRGRTTATLDVRAFAGATGGRYFSIMRGEIEEALREKLSVDVEVRYGTGVARIDDTADRLEVSLTDGTALQADLVIGADGLHSHVRSLLGIREPDVIRDLGYVVTAFTLRDDRLAAEAGDLAQLTDQVGSQFALAAVDLGRPAERPEHDRGHVSAFLVRRSDAGIPALSAADEARRLLPASGPFGAAAARSVPEDVYRDVVAQSIVPRWHGAGGRVLLAGDAAHAVSLLAGQGAAMALAGAVALARAVAAAPDAAAAARAYDRALRPTVEAVQAAGRRAASSFVPDNARQLWTRRVILAIARIPFVARFVAARLTAAPTH